MNIRRIEFLVESLDHSAIDRNLRSAFGEASDLNENLSKREE